MSSDGYAYLIQRTVQTLVILSERPVTGVELAVALRVHPRTARSYLRRFVRDGFAQRTERGYEATPLVAVLGYKLIGRPLPRPPGADDFSLPPGGCALPPPWADLGPRA